MADYFGVAAAEIRSDRWIYLAIGVYCLVAVLYLAIVNSFDPAIFATTLLVYALTSIAGYGFTFPLLLLIIGIVHITLRLAARRRLGYGAMFGPRRMGRLIAGSALMLGMVPFRAAFNVVKVSIPDHGGFLHDVWLADFDKALHFNIDPFHLVHAVGESNFLLRAIELNYNNLWFVVVFGALYWVAVSPGFDAVRLRFVLCFMLAWAITGSVFAVLGSSAGPVYYGAITGDLGRFGALVDFVNSTRGQPGSAGDYQHYLWELEVGGRVGLGSGISAFPSMHVAMISVLALFITEASRRWGPVAWAYVGITVFSSVYLGWHYAVDGYVAILLTVGTHLLVRKAFMTRWRWSRAAAPAEQQA